VGLGLQRDRGVERDGGEMRWVMGLERCGVEMMRDD